MSKTVKIILISFVILAGIVIFTTVIKTTSKVFDIFELARSISKEYSLTDNKIVIYDQMNIQKTLQFKDSTTYVLHFWATWCKPCIEKFDSIEKYHKSWKNVKIAVITLESNEKMQTFLKNKSWDLPFYSTDSLKLPFNPKTIQVYPSDFIIKNDSLIHVGFGPIEWKDAFK